MIVALGVFASLGLLTPNLAGNVFQDLGGRVSAPAGLLADSGVMPPVFFAWQVRAKRASMDAKSCSEGAHRRVC